MNTIVKIEIVAKKSTFSEEKDMSFLPFKAHYNDAAYDIMAADLAIIKPLETRVIPAGFRIELEPGFEAQIRPRSGNAIKKKLQIANSPGTIDCGYTGEVGVIVFNSDSQKELVINRGDKIAQMVIAELPNVSLEIVDSINRNTDRGEEGFGSTGVVGK